MFLGSKYKYSWPFSSYVDSEIINLPTYSDVLISPKLVHRVSQLFVDICKVEKKCEKQICLYPQLKSNMMMLCLLVSTLQNRCSLNGLFVTILISHLCFLYLFCFLTMKYELALNPQLLPSYFSAQMTGTCCDSQLRLCFLLILSLLRESPKHSAIAFYYDLSCILLKFKRYNLT